jgi:hypothetical protein
MSIKYYVVSTEVEGRRFQILDFDKQTKVAKLQGEQTPFEQSLEPELLKELGYKIVREEEPDAEQPELQA